MAATIDSSTWEIPRPVLFNPWKHHAVFLRARIEATARNGQAALAELAAELLVIGSELMDFYVGTLSPHAIADAVISQLRGENRLDLTAYNPWVAAGGGYRVLSLPCGSRLVLR